MQGQIAGVIGRPILKGTSCRGNRTADIEFWNQIRVVVARLEIE
jgi:hypothetical protein